MRPEKSRKKRSTRASETSRGRQAQSFWNQLSPNVLISEPISKSNCRALSFTVLAEKQNLSNVQYTWNFILTSLLILDPNLGVEVGVQDELHALIHGHDLDPDHVLVNANANGNENEIANGNEIETENAIEIVVEIANEIEIGSVKETATETEIEENEIGIGRGHHHHHLGQRNGAATTAGAIIDNHHRDDLQRCGEVKRLRQVSCKSTYTIAAISFETEAASENS